MLNAIVGIDVGKKDLSISMIINDFLNPAIYFIESIKYILVFCKIINLKNI